MKSYLKSRLLTMLAPALLVFGGVGSSWADPILESGSFSIGLGAFSNTGAAINWTTNETSGVNTLPGGNIGLTLSVHSPTFSSGGPGFENRVLGDQDGTHNRSGYNSEVGSPDWGATITATYTGPFSLPPDATILIQIDSISMYGLGFSNNAFNGIVGPTADMAFFESTSGHNATSPSQNLNIISTGVGTAANYTQLVWNPSDFSLLYNSATRTFALSTDGDNPTVDGFEISGTITVFIPEPSTACLALFAAACFIRRRS